MKRNPTNEAISALKVAPIQTLGMCVSAEAALYLFSTDSKWFGTAVLVGLIFKGLVWVGTPGIIQEANERARAIIVSRTKSEENHGNDYNGRPQASKRCCSIGFSR